MPYDDKLTQLLAHNPETMASCNSRPRNPENSEIALKTLSKFDAAGRIMETDQGIEAAKPCTQCEGTNSNCMVFAHLSDGDQVVCAYCERYARADCNASHPGPKQHEVSSEVSANMFAVLESRLLAVEKRYPSTQSRSSAPSTDNMFKALEGRFRAFEKEAMRRHRECPLRAMRVTALTQENRKLREQTRAFEARLRALEFTVGHCSVHGQYLKSPVSS